MNRTCSDCKYFKLTITNGSVQVGILNPRWVNGICYCSPKPVDKLDKDIACRHLEEIK